MTKIAVFASGNGSNLQALIDAIDRRDLRAEIKLVVCDRPGAFAITRALKARLEVLAFNPKEYASKAAYEEIISKKLAQLEIEYLVLAGYMRIIGPTLLNKYTQRIINIHPSLLPLFPGKDGVGQALRAGVTETGVTIHYVDEGIDTGPIIAQERISIAPGETRASLEARIHHLEHCLYPQILEGIVGAKGGAKCKGEL